MRLVGACKLPRGRILHLPALILHDGSHLAAGLFRAFHQPCAVVLRDVAGHNKVPAAVFTLVDRERQAETIGFQVVVEVSHGVGIEHLAQCCPDATLAQQLHAVMVGAVIRRTVQHDLLGGKLAVPHIVEAEQRIVVRLAVSLCRGVVRLIAVVQASFDQRLCIADDGFKIVGE